MDVLPGGDDTARQLRATVLREFEPDPGRPEGAPRGDPANYIDIAWAASLVPAVMLLGLRLIGLDIRGPQEKVAWWTSFSFRGHRYELAHRKFGLRLPLLDAGIPEVEAQSQLDLVRYKLVASQRLVERTISRASKALIEEGAATVVNRHHRLQRTYEYFRERAITPAVVEDVHTHDEFGSGGSWSTFVSGQAVMELNATHDMVAAVTAYLSRLEHDLVLALPFAGFDSEKDHLTQFIGSRWGIKFHRVLGGQGRANEMLGRLTGVVERWRNPYAHGGFEKGNGSTIYVHVPQIGPLPVGLSMHRGRPVFPLSTADASTKADVFAFLDEFDEWWASAQPRAAEWIRQGLDARFDSSFREQLDMACIDDEAFSEFVLANGMADDRARNMDY